ncbi:unnamed protein product [Dicrocoelium dendriticum]|nr:unnamed protein product [Dicrocoelium dendriticum]
MSDKFGDGSQEYWRNTFTTPGSVGTRPPPDAVEDYDLISQITVAEIQNVLKGSNTTSPGPDALTTLELRRMNSSVLAQVFNLMLVLQIPTKADSLAGRAYTTTRRVTDPKGTGNPADRHYRDRTVVRGPYELWLHSCVRYRARFR